MILFDTDHLTVLQLPGSDRRARLVERMALSPDGDFGATIISAEEQLRGWLASIARERTAGRQVQAYLKLAELLAFLNAFDLARYDDAAAAQFERFQAAKLRVSTMDLKIAAIALVRGALLLTANRRDFEKVPGLRFENWLDPPPT